MNSISIKRYSKKLYSLYPRYSKYLKLNIYISDYILDMQLKNTIPTELQYKTKFDKLAQLELAKEIIGSLSSELLNKFEIELQKGNIILGNKKTDYSYTTVEENCIKCYIYENDTIAGVMCIIHEFFHLIHLEKYDNDMANEDYYYFTEIMGIAADIYSVFYLAFRRKVYVEDIKAYLSEYFVNIVNMAQQNLSLGFVLDICKTEGNLSSKAIKKYINNNKITYRVDYVIKLAKKFHLYEYSDISRYIFSFPVAFEIASQLFIDKSNYDTYKKIFDKLASISPEDCMNELGLDDYINDEHYLQQLMDAIYSNFIDIFSLDNSKKREYKK